MEHLTLPPSAGNVVRTSGFLEVEQTVDKLDPDTRKLVIRNGISKPCIVYIAREDYRGVPFREYFDRYESTYTADQYDSFMQTWMFFCLLQDVLGRRFRHSDFVRSRTAKDRILISHHTAAKSKKTKVLTTAKLNKLLQGLDDDIKKAKKRNNRAYLMHLEQLYYDVSDCYDRRAVARTNMPTEMQELFWTIPDLLAEALWHNGVAIAPGSVVPLSPDFPEEEFWNASWCPADARRAWTQMSSFPARHYWLNMKLPKAHNEDHSSCTQRECSLAQIDPKSYKLGHSSPGCMCPQIRFDRNILIELLQKTPRAVLKIPNKADWHVREVIVVELTPDIEYITLSHVWADGMGNPHENALHTCMVVKFVEASRSLYQKLFRKEQPYMYVWCDTLCIPTGTSDIKPKALKEMRTIYSSSVATLVIDAMLEQHELRPSPDETWVEAAFFIILSRWMSRLWTLQEAVLSKRLWFKFKGSFSTLGAIRRAMGNIAETCASKRKASLAIPCLSVIKSLHIFSDHPCDPRSVLHLLESQLKTRSVSNRDDAAICLSNLVDAMLGHVHFPPCLTMVEFWKACAELDLLDGLTIFHDHPTLDQPGFRWAPYDLLGGRTGSKYLTPATLGHDPGPRKPRLVAEGLMLHKSALIVSACPGLDMKHLMLSACLTGRAFQLLDGTGHCWTVDINQCFANILYNAWSMRKMAILLESARGLQGVHESQSTFAFGVLVVVAEEHEHYTAVRRIGPCRLRSTGLSYRPIRRLPPFDLHGFQGSKDETSGTHPIGLLCYSATGCQPRVYATELLSESHRWIVD